MKSNDGLSFENTSNVSGHSHTLVFPNNPNVGMKASAGDYMWEYTKDKKWVIIGNGTERVYFGERSGVRIKYDFENLWILLVISIIALIITLIAALHGDDYDEKSITINHVAHITNMSGNETLDCFSTYMFDGKLPYYKSYTEDNKKVQQCIRYVNNNDAFKNDYSMIYDKKIKGYITSDEELDALRPMFVSIMNKNKIASSNFKSYVKKTKSSYPEEFLNIDKILDEMNINDKIDINDQLEIINKGQK